LSSVQILRRDHIPGAQFLLTLYRDLIENQFRFRLPELTLRLLERRLVGPWINRKKQIALFHIGAILKITGDDLAAHLRLDLDGLIRSTSANFIEVKGHILYDNLGDKNRSHRRLGSFGLAGPVLKNPIQDKRGEQEEK